MELSFLIVAVAAFLAAGLTMYSGFGLGTLMLPVFALFLPVEIGVDGSLGGPATVRVRPAPADAGGRTQGTEAPCSAGT